VRLFALSEKRFPRCSDRAKAGFDSGKSKLVQALTALHVLTLTDVLYRSKKPSVISTYFYSQNCAHLTLSSSLPFSPPSTAFDTFLLLLQTLSPYMKNMYGIGAIPTLTIANKPPRPLELHVMEHLRNEHGHHPRPPLTLKTS